MENISYWQNYTIIVVKVGNKKEFRKKKNAKSFFLNYYYLTLKGINSIANNRNSIANNKEI